MTWNEILKEEGKKPYWGQLQQFLEEAYTNHTIYPPKEKILNALKLTPYEDVKCVILGQDPYHEKWQAMGLAFSVERGVKIPPSLRNMYKELNAEFGYEIPEHGDLTDWAKQGVLLLNTVLTVEEGKADSHKKKGWEFFTDAIIQAVNEKETPVVFLLWGNNARSKKELITNPEHLILEAAHPSPLSASRGFFGCGHFKACNDYLKSHGLEPINWRILVTHL